MQTELKKQRDWFSAWVVLWAFSMAFAILVRIVGNTYTAQVAWIQAFSPFTTEITGSDIAASFGPSLLHAVSTGISALLVFFIAVRERSGYTLFVSFVLFVGTTLASTEASAIGVAYLQFRNFAIIGGMIASFLTLGALLTFPNGRFASIWVGLILPGYMLYMAGRLIIPTQAYFEAGQFFVVETIVVLIWRYTQTHNPIRRSQFRWLFAAIAVNIFANLFLSQGGIDLWRSLTGETGMDSTLYWAIRIAGYILVPFLIYFAMCDKFAFLRPANLWADIRAVFSPIFRVAFATPTYSEDNEDSNKNAR